MAWSAHGWRPGSAECNGLTVTDGREVPGLERTIEMDVTTPSITPRAVHGPHRLRITLPESYRDDPTTRYPVLYLLHGGDGGSALQWSTGGGEVERFTAGHDVITVMPDGGKVGWYVDWTDAANGPQAWEHYHLLQLLPWVDANLRTIARPDARAVAGMSMGGYGAIRYAQRRPDLFAAAVSLSGALTLRHPMVRATTIEQSMVNRLGRSGPFGANRHSPSTWSQNDPLADLERLRDTFVVLHAGQGSPWRDPIEWVVASTTATMHAALDAAGIEHVYWKPTHPPRSGSQHSFWYWNAAMEELVPQILDELAPAGERSPMNETSSTAPSRRTAGETAESTTGPVDRTQRGAR